jgi:hypothetical protein
MDDDPDPTPAEELWWSYGMHPPWKRVWHEGVDVTDQDPATWPKLWQPDVQIRSDRHSRGARRQH